MPGATAAALTTARSGATRGAAIGHISPEAAAGGPIALVQEGDEIEIDIAAKRITLLVSDDELARRRETWTPPAPKMRGGYLERYARMVTSASQGAVLRP